MPTTMDAGRLIHEWPRIRAQVKEHWGQLSDDDLIIHGGNVEQFLNRLHKVAGVELSEVQSYLSTLLYGGSSHGARVATEARETLRGRVSEAAHHVRSRPASSVGTALIFGVVAGIAFGLALRRGS